eukprot:2661905-Pyramimonas_sp.AAC.1
MAADEIIIPVPGLAKPFVQVIRLVPCNKPQAAPARATPDAARELPAGSEVRALLSGLRESSKTL